MQNIANEKSVPLNQTGLFGGGKDRIEEVSERSQVTGQTSMVNNSPKEIIRDMKGSYMSLPNANHGSTMNVSQSGRSKQG